MGKLGQFFPPLPLFSYSSSLFGFWLFDQPICSTRRSANRNKMKVCAALTVVVLFFVLFGGSGGGGGGGGGKNNENKDVVIPQGESSNNVVNPPADSSGTAETTTSLQGEVTVKDHKTSHSSPTTKLGKDGLPLLLDEDAILLKAETHFEKAIAEQLITHQEVISNDVNKIIDDMRAQLDPKNQGRQSLDMDDIERIGNLSEDELRERIRSEIDDRCDAMLKEKTEDMESAADIDAEAESRGAADPINLSKEEKALVKELKAGVDTIIDEVRRDIPGLAVPILKWRIESSLNKKYPKYCPFTAYVKLKDDDNSEESEGPACESTICFHGWQRGSTNSDLVCRSSTVEESPPTSAPLPDPTPALTEKEIEEVATEEETTESSVEEATGAVEEATESEVAEEPVDAEEDTEEESDGDEEDNETERDVDLDLKANDEAETEPALEIEEETVEEEAEEEVKEDGESVESSETNDMTTVTEEEEETTTEDQGDEVAVNTEEEDSKGDATDAAEDLPDIADEVEEEGDDDDDDDDEDSSDVDEEAEAEVEVEEEKSSSTVETEESTSVEESTEEAVEENTSVEADSEGDDDDDDDDDEDESASESESEDALDDGDDDDDDDEDSEDDARRMLRRRQR